MFKLLRYLTIPLAALGLLAALPAPAAAQQTALAVTTCGTQTLIAGRYYSISQDLTGNACGNGSGGGGGGGGGGGTIITPTSLLPYAFNNLDGSGNLGSQAAESCHVIKANPGNVYYLDAHELSAGGATDFVFVLNLTACPSNGTMTAGTRLLSSAVLAPTQTWSWTSGSPIPLPASAGIVIVCSTTDWPTLTLDTAHCLFNWGYE